MGHWEPHRRDESRVFHHSLLNSLGMGAENELRPQLVCSGAGEETGRLDMEERRESEALKLTYLLCITCFSGKLACLASSQGLPTGVGAGVKQ